MIRNIFLIGLNFDSLYQNIPNIQQRRDYRLRENEMKIHIFLKLDIFDDKNTNEMN